MAATPELLKVVNLIMKRQQLETQDADAINERQFRKITEIDIDEKVKSIKSIVLHSFNTISKCVVNVHFKNQKD